MKKFSNLTGFAGLLTALVLVCTLVFAGCDNSSDSGGGDDNSVTYESTAADGNPIVVIVKKGGSSNLRYDPKNGDTYTLKYNGTVVSTGTITVRGTTIDFTNSNGTFSATIGGTGDATLTFTADIVLDDAGLPPIPVPPLPLAGTVTISGNAMVGQTLSAVITGITNGKGTATYEWKQSDTDPATVIGTNSATYELVATDETHTITVTVSYSGNTESLTSAATAAVGPNTLVALTGKPTITGTAMVGQTLTAGKGTLDGNGTATYTWKAGVTEVGTNQDTYVPAVADIGKPSPSP